MRAVCSWLTILFVLTRLSLKVFSLQNSDDDEYLPKILISSGSGEENPYVDVNIYLLGVEVKAWQNGYYTNITHDTMELTVRTLLDRFGCPGDSFQEMSEACCQCSINITNHVFSMVTMNDDVISETEFDEASVVLFYIFSLNDIQSTCNMSLWLTSTDEYTQALLSKNGSEEVLTKRELDLTLEVMSPNYTPETLAKCFDSGSLFDLAVDDHEEGATLSELYTLSSFTISYLIQGLCIGSPTKVDPIAFIEDVFTQYGQEGIINKTVFEDILIILGIGGTSYPITHTKRSADQNSQRVLIARAADYASEIKNVTNTCFSGDEIWDIYDIDHEIGMNENEFQEMCPSLVQQLLRQPCSQSPSNSQDISKEVLIYGSLSVFIISLASLFGGLLFPCLSANSYEKIINSLISLAISVLVGDAIIHLLPMAFGLHDHEVAYLWKTLACVLAVYLFYLFETLMGWFTGHDHSSSDVMIPMNETRNQRNGSIPKTFSQAALTDFDDLSPEIITMGNQNCLKRYGPIPVMIVVGDALHNLGDGLAIGASFAAGVSSGISTSLAVFCHEVPHELGDLAILLKSGIKLKWALFLNLMSSVSAFVGLYVGIFLAQTEVARQWIFAVTAGMFLYVALADMVPQIANIKKVKDPVLTFLLQNVFFVSGIAFIFLMALYEDKITVNIT